MIECLANRSGSIYAGDRATQEAEANEKNITYPTGTKLAIKIINCVNKLAKRHEVEQRRTSVKEVKALRLASRHFRHVKRRRKAVKALERLRTL
ncbi:MAG: IS5 family transposase [Gammaproteobacteria bacterium]|jgi:IS5 family transposase